MENIKKDKIFIKIVISILCIIGIVSAIYLVKYVENEMNYQKRMDSILSDSEEIEKKWLIDKNNIPYNLNNSSVEKIEIKQTYLCFDPEMRVRNYNNGQSYEFTIKNNMSEDGMIRDEENLDITREQYENLIKKQEENTINKTRYQLYADGQLIAIDIFHDELDGLAYMEIEFPNEEEAREYKNPSWIIKDVTDDINYKNGHLARYGIPADAYK